MSDASRGIIIAVVILAVAVAFIWYKGNQRPELGACARWGGNSSVTIYYRQGDPSYATYTSPDCSSESRITI
ncbi:MAG TPA: hypothetical protein VHW68_01565 [Actinomycetota bacterium]|jgi:hypothetical protein|nr:hypothetical protein [Actinomycetota bacterium]